MANINLFLANISEEGQLFIVIGICRKKCKKNSK
jgi:hypothetical protein